MTQPWMIEARKWLGTKEFPGRGSNPVIMGWIKRMGAKVLGITVNGDDVPWCGSFAAHCITSVGLTPPPIAVRASSWAMWGRALIAPRPGCILVFVRSGGGHVGFYAGETKDKFRVLGGNQSDAVTETWIAKDRLAPNGMRWPWGVTLPPKQHIWLADDGKPVSRNEA